MKKRDTLEFLPDPFPDEQPKMLKPGIPGM